MPPFRIPFTSKKPVPNGVDVNDENTRPASHGSGAASPYQSKSSLALNVKEKKENSLEYKLSSVDDQGQYLPPSPKEENKSFWGRSPTNTSSHRSLLSETEPFSISRESFESYRRSFDVSGRSPIIHSDSYTSRSSLDGRSFYYNRSALNGNTFDRPPTVPDEDFEDVKLGDDVAKQQPKKKSFLSRFNETSNDATANGEKSHRFHIPGRSRGQSGSGAELGEVQRPTSKGNNEVEVS